MAGTFVQNLKAGWNAWKRIAQRIGNFQARVLLTILYAVVVLPFGLMSRLFSDSLQIKKRPTQWIDHPADVHDMSWAQKQ
jgi:hypothetical protein